MTTTALPEAPVAPVKAPTPPGPRFVVNRAAMLSAVDMANGIALARSPKPILQCVMIDATGDKLIVRATNLEMSVSSEVGLAQIESAGRCVVKGDTLLDLLKNSTAETVTMDATGRKRDGKLNVADDDSDLNLPLNNPEEFPSAGDVHDAMATVTMPLAVIVKTLTRAAIFTEKDATRYAFNGILFRIEKTKITFASADGRRLFVDHGPAHSDGTCMAIVPTAAISRVVKFTGEEITIGLSGNRATFTVDSTTLTTNVLEGHFPPYDDVIPKECDRIFKVGREYLATCVRKGALFTTEASKIVRMSFDRRGLRLSSRSPELGEGDVNCPAKYEGVDMEIGVNPKYLLDCLTGETDDVTISMHAPNRPMLISDSTNAKIVLMPANLQ